MPPSAAEYYFERHIIFEISLREISKMMCLSKDNLARSAVKILFTQPQNMGFVKRNCGIMSEKFRNKYRIASHRKPLWDYSANALYFLTIVTQNPNYHDHIIRNQLEYLNISHYIINNPQNWNKDKLNINLYN